MASFTSRDTIPFTPYIETNPVDAYLRVGMYKEQQLAAGLQRVQQYVDTLTGLPIVKPEDKEYVQNKLSSLKSGITKNLSGDFSDSRIVNQIAGAAKSIYSDPVVRNSVEGTMAAQKVDADIEEAKKKGTWNAANEYVVKNGINNWLADKTVGSKFSQYFTGYTPYTDVNAEFLKYWKETNPTEDMSNAYYTDADGNTKINPVLFKGKSPAQIQAVWNLVKGNANVQQQLGINGQYQYRGVTPEQLYTSLGQETKATIDKNNELILNLQAKAAVGDVKAANHIQELKAMNIEAEKSLSTYAQTLQTNPNAVKSALSSQQQLSSLIGAYSYQVMEKSPLWETSFEQNKFDVQTRQWEMDFQQKQTEFAWKQRMDSLNYELDKEKKKKEGQADAGIVNPTAVNPSEAVKDENTARNAVTATQASYTQSMRELAATMSQGTELAPPYINQNGTWVPNVGPDRPYKTEAEANQVAKTLTGKAKDAYINGSLEGRPNEIMAQAEDKYKNLEAAQKIVTEVEAGFAPQTAQLAQTLGAITDDPQLRTDFVKAYQVDHELPGWEATVAGLRQKYGTDWKNGMGIKEFVQSGGTGGAGVDPNMKINAQNLNAYTQASKKLKANPTLVSLAQAKDAAYKSRQTVEQGYEVTLNTAKGETKEGARNLYASIAGQVTALNPSSTKGEYKDFEKFLSGKDIEQNVYSHYINPITHQGQLIVRRGNDMARIDVPESVILQHWPETSTFSAFREKFQTPLSLNQGAYTGKTFTDAYKADQGANSPYITKYHIVGNGDGTYGIRWWVADNKGPGQPAGAFHINGEIMDEKYGIPSQMSEEQVMSIITNLKDKSFVEQRLILNQKLQELRK